MSCQAVSYKSKSIGKYFKFTKKEYNWDFILENQNFNLKLLYSKLSNKYEIKLNGRSNYKFKGNQKFYHSFEILNHLIKIKRKGDGFELYIDNNSFGDIMEGVTVIDSNSKSQNTRYSNFSNNNHINKNNQNFHNKRNTNFNIPQFNNNFNQASNRNSNFFIPSLPNNNTNIFNPNNNSTNFNPNNIPNFNNNTKNILNNNNTQNTPKLDTQSSEKYFTNLNFLPTNE